jgi:transposase, IS30 family
MGAKRQYQHLTLAERKLIVELKHKGMSLRDIANLLNRSPSTISRELKRNVHINGTREYYTYKKADEKYKGRLRRSRSHSYFSEKEWDIIKDKIRMDWSPEQIARTLSKEGIVSISHETIYRMIYKDKRSGGNLYAHLRHRCRKRRKRYRSKDSRGRLAGKRMISERPKHIENRKEIGHWEIDTVMGKNNKTCIVTMVERSTGYVAIGKLINKTAQELTKKTIKMITRQHLPVLTITSDNGSEFHGYKDIEKATGAIFYFANPHHAWERGTNENTNGLIRQYLPKRTSMEWVTQAHCNAIADRLNDRPRKRLYYDTPRSRSFSVA